MFATESKTVTRFSPDSSCKCSGAKSGVGAWTTTRIVSNCTMAGSGYFSTLAAAHLGSIIRRNSVISL